MVTTERETQVQAGADYDMVRSQQYMLELVATLLASCGFIVLLVGAAGTELGSAMGCKHCWRIQKRTSQLLICTHDWVHRASACTILRIAIYHSVDLVINQELHASCPGPGDGQDRKRVLRALKRVGNIRADRREEDDIAPEVNESNDFEAGRIDFKRTWVAQFLLPATRSTLTTKLTIAERYPMIGPTGQSTTTSYIFPLWLTMMRMGFPTRQMKAYKKALKESAGCSYGVAN